MWEKSKWVVVLILGGVTLNGCVIIGSQAWFEERSYGKEALASRASFDLGCPVAKLGFTPLGNNGDYRTSGVAGCGKKASYVFVDNKWVMNSEGKDESSP